MHSRETSPGLTCDQYQFRSRSSTIIIIITAVYRISPTDVQLLLLEEAYILNPRI